MCKWTVLLFLQEEYSLARWQEDSSERSHREWVENQPLHPAHHKLAVMPTLTRKHVLILSNRIGNPARMAL